MNGDEVEEVLGAGWWSADGEESVGGTSWTEAAGELWPEE